MKKLLGMFMALGLVSVLSFGGTGCAKKVEEAKKTEVKKSETTPEGTTTETKTEETTKETDKKTP